MEATTPTRRAVSRGSILGTARHRRGEEMIRAALFAAAAVSILTTIGIVLSLATETVNFFEEVPFDRFITDSEWAPLFAEPQYGIWPLLNGTLLITAIGIVVALPLGLGAAVYLSEYASSRVRRTVKPALEVLVGVPTVVFGYFALTFVTPTILEGLFGIELKIFNALSAGIVMGFMILPTIASISEDAMRAVPQALRDGAYGLGASKRQVAARVVFPAALSGIVAAVVLGISRAIGETMIVLVAAGQQPNTGLDVRQSFETITTFIAATAKGDAATGSIAYKTIFAAGATLFLLTLAMNLIAIRFVRRFREVYE